MAASSNRSLLNEAACPVELEVLALLMRSDERTRQAMITQMDGRLRAQLALFCYNRVHLRQLAFQIAALCELRDLRIVAGPKGDLLFQQARESQSFEEEPITPRRKGVTLARSARD